MSEFFSKAVDIITSAQERRFKSAMRYGLLCKAIEGELIDPDILAKIDALACEEFQAASEHPNSWAYADALFLRWVCKQMKQTEAGVSLSQETVKEVIYSARTAPGKFLPMTHCFQPYITLPGLYDDHPDTVRIELAGLIKGKQIDLPSIDLSKNFIADVQSCRSIFS